MFKDIFLFILYLFDKKILFVSGTNTLIVSVVSPSLFVCLFVFFFCKFAKLKIFSFTLNAFACTCDTCKLIDYRSVNTFFIVYLSINNWGKRSHKWEGDDYIINNVKGLYYL